MLVVEILGLLAVGLLLALAWARLAEATRVVDAAPFDPPASKPFDWQDDFVWSELEAFHRERTG